MKIIDEIISTIDTDSSTRQIMSGVHWTAVLSKNCGLSSTFQDPPPHKPVRDVGCLTRKSALELAEYSKSEVQLEASIGMAALNSLIDVERGGCEQVNAFKVLAEKGEGRDVVVVGHFPFIPRLKDIARRLWVLEKRPREDDLSAESAEDILPRAHVIGITGTSFINHTIDELLSLCDRASWVMMIGGTTPMSPILFDYGVNMIAGSVVTDAQTAIRCIGEGATFRQIRGIEHLVMEKP